MAAVLSLHDRLAYVLVLYYTAVGLWGLWLASGTARIVELRGAVVIATIAALQGPLRRARVLLLGGRR